MNTDRPIRKNFLKRIGVWIVIASFFVTVFGQLVYGHGGEDHGDSAPKVTTTEKGSVSRSARSGNIELTVKHPVLEPDVATAGNIFITDYQTNAAFDKASISAEVENANGPTISIPVDKSEQAGIFSLKIPALPEGNYTMRVKLAYDGSSDTVTFSGVNVEQATASDNSTGISWVRGILLFLTGALVLALFGGLFFFVWRSADASEIQGEALSA